MVANKESLLEGAACLHPAIVVIDMSLCDGDMGNLLACVAERTPEAKMLLISVHDEPTVVDAALLAGAYGVVLKRSLGTDLMPAVDALLAGQRYISPGISRVKGTPS